MDTPATPFTLPPVVMTPVTPDELLTLLRETIPVVYMSSSEAYPRCMSKPHYEMGVSDHINQTTVPSRGTGCYRDTDAYGHVYPGDAIWAFINTSTVMVLCNLKTDDLYVRLNAPDATWFPYVQPVAMDRLELIDQIAEFF